MRCANSPSSGSIKSFSTASVSYRKGSLDPPPDALGIMADMMTAQLNGYAGRMYVKLQIVSWSLLRTRCRELQSSARSLIGGPMMFPDPEHVEMRPGRKASRLHYDATLDVHVHVNTHECELKSSFYSKRSFFVKSCRFLRSQISLSLHHA
jgi:hypothetical protein